MRAGTVFVAALAAALIGGCGVGAPSGRPTVRPTQDEHFNAVWEAATEVLREYRFTIDRADTRAGVITTLPLLSRHGLEVWRKDAVTPRDQLEGTLQSIYRQAEVVVRRRDPAADADLPQGKYLADVAVRTSRSNRPTLQVTSTADAYDLFGAPEELGRAYGEPQPEQRSYRTGLGRDGNLEAILRQRIHRAAARKLTVYPK